MKLFYTAIILFVALLLSACGGGGGGSVSPPPQYSAVTLKLITAGTPSKSLRGVGVKITLPDGVTPPLNADRSVDTSKIKVSGVAGDGISLTDYTAAASPAKGTLLISLSSTTPEGFGAGEFALVTLNIDAGSIPGPVDFALSELDPIDFGLNHATGLTVSYTAEFR